MWLYEQYLVFKNEIAYCNVVCKAMTVFQGPIKVQQTAGNSIKNYITFRLNKKYNLF